MIPRLSGSKRTRYSLALLAVALVPLLLILLSIERFPPVAEVFADGRLTVGIDASFPPFGMILDGQYTGIDADLGAALAESFGLQLELVPTNFDGAYDAVLVGRADLVLAGLPIDRERTADITYTWAYFNDGLMIASLVSAPIIDGAGLSGLRVAVEFGSAADVELRLWLRRVRGITPLHLDTAQAALQALQEGFADAALVDSITCAAADVYCARLTDQLIAGIVRADRRAVHYHINRALLDLLNSGEVDAILARHIPGYP